MSRSVSGRAVRPGGPAPCRATCCSAGRGGLGRGVKRRPAFGAVPDELLIALPHLVVIAALAVRGRGVRYPGAYLTPYRRA